MDFKMKFRLLAMAAGLVCCLSCIEKDYSLGGVFVPVTETYTFHTAEIPLEGITMQMADKLSGYSDDRITVGAIREPEFGLTTRASAFTLVPVIIGEFNLGQDPVFKSFHFAAARDTLSVLDPSQENILQNLHVYELSAPLDATKDYDLNQTVKHGDRPITRGTPVYNGLDSLSFDFSEEFGRKYLQITKDDVSDMKKYIAKFPGIYIESDVPEGDGGRINMLDVQLSYDAQNEYVRGNYATLRYSAVFNGVRKDTAIVFYYGAADFFDIDSLFNAYTGTFPQYCLNLTGQQTRERAGTPGETIWVEGGGGLKPTISAKSLKHQVEQAIAAAGGDPKDAVINKATLVFPFDFPDDYKDMTFWPYRLSPTCRFTGEESTSFMGLTDSSSSDENQGDVDRSHMRYAPDITYHMQELVKIDESKTESTGAKNLEKGNYDIWLLIMAMEEELHVSTTSKEQQEMLNYLAYSSYYNSMYGGYGGYGGYGYGGYGGYGAYGYNNYLNYAMMAQYASMAQTSTSSTVKLDKDRFYRASLCGPAYPDADRRPKLLLTFALPNQD